jgi:hypothetical protein
MPREEVVDVGLEPIDADLRACLEQELALPGVRLVKRKGRLFLKGKGGFEILAERLCEIKARWVELVENAPLTQQQREQIFCMLLAREDARVEEMPGLGLKVILPASNRH